MRRVQAQPVLRTDLLAESFEWMRKEAGGYASLLRMSRWCWMERTEGNRRPRADSLLFAGVGSGPVVAASFALYPVLTLVMCVAIQALNAVGDLLFMLVLMGVGLPLTVILAVVATVMALIAAWQRGVVLAVLGALAVGGMVSMPIGMAILFPS